VTTRDWERRTGLAGADRLCWSFHGPPGDAHPRLDRAASAFAAFFPREALRPAPGEHLGLHNGRRGGRLVTMDWYEWPDALGPAGVAFADFVLSVPRAPYAVFAAEDLTFRLAEAVGPWHGRVHTTASARAVECQKVTDPSRVRIPAPFGLPHLFCEGRRRHPLVPLEVTWINVWCADTCELLGFRERDERLFGSVRTTSDGARVLTLTTLPLDPAANPAHREALRAVYGRFPRIGSRG
jgi:hypothetical protein